MITKLLTKNTRGSKITSIIQPASWRRFLLSKPNAEPPMQTSQKIDKDAYISLKLRVMASLLSYLLNTA